MGALELLARRGRGQRLHGLDRGGAARALRRARRRRHPRRPRGVPRGVERAGRGRVRRDARSDARAGSRACPTRSRSCPRTPTSSRSSRRSTVPTDADGDTTNLVSRRRDGNACVLTTSLGLGSGDYVPGLDLHLNSMLGEADLVRGEARPGRADELDDGAEHRARRRRARARDRRGGRHAAAHGARRRRERDPRARRSPAGGGRRGRAHPVGGLVHAEPGVSEEGLAELERRGRTVRRWPARHHYFGGVSAIGRSGPAADPRRSGCGALLA